MLELEPPHGVVVRWRIAPRRKAASDSAKGGEFESENFRGDDIRNHRRPHLGDAAARRGRAR
jgi:hypothetical protein